MKYKSYTKWSGKQAMDLEDTIGFGKAHFGEKLRVVLYSDPNWVKFCVDRGYIVLSKKAETIMEKNVAASAKEYIPSKDELNLGIGK